MNTEIILLTIIVMGGAFGIGYMHEQVHVEIFTSYGIESHVEYLSHFPNFVTIAEEPCPSDACTMAHNINEAIGYPLSVLYTIFALLLLYRIMLAQFMLELKLDERD